MKSVLYLLNQRIPTQKAYGLQVSKMCEAFAETGSQVELAIPIRQNSIRDPFSYYGVKNNFKLTELYSPDFYWPGVLDKVAVAIKNLISALRLSGYARKSNADVIYSRDELPLYFLSFFKKNLTFEAHRFSSKRFWFYHRFKKANVKIVSISSGLKNEFVKFGFPQDCILVAHDGVDLNEFDIPDNQEEYRKELGLPLDKKIVGYVGQLRTMGMEKGVQLLIEAQVLLKKDHPDASVMIVGGSDSDLKKYKDLARELGLDEGDIIFTGQKEHHLIPKYLKSCDVLAMPFPNNKHFAHYMSPLKMFEYMAAKRPIVVSDLPSIREILDEKSAVFFDSDQTKSLLLAVKKILENNNLAPSVSGQAYKKVKENTWVERSESISNFMLVKTKNKRRSRRLFYDLKGIKKNHGFKIAFYYLAVKAITSIPPISQLFRKSLKNKLFVRVKILNRWMYLNLLDPGISYKLIVHGVREQGHVKQISDSLKEGMIGIDIGANIGYYALLESELIGPTGKIYAIEPAPDNFILLKKNIAENNFDNRVERFQYLVGNKDDNAELFLSAAANSHSISHISNRSVKLPMVTLNNFMASRNIDPSEIDFFRMDIEGYEVMTIPHMESLFINRKKPLKLFIEIHPTAYGEWGWTLGKFIEYLVNKGFVLKSIVKKGDDGSEIETSVNSNYGKKAADILKIITEKNVLGNLFFELPDKEKNDPKKN